MRPFHPLYILKVLPEIMRCFPVTVLMVVGTLFFGGVGGLILAAAKLSRSRIARAIANVYTYVVRCVPSIVMLFIVYYGLPEFLLAFGIDINSYSKGVFVIAALSIMYSATISEVFRSAYLSVDRGQKEAALSSGLSEFQAFWRIVFPQCVVIALPNYTNALINLMKEGALAYTIGLIDIVGKGNQIIGRNQGAYTLETYLALGLIYWTLTIIIQKGMGALERQLLKGRKALIAN